MTMTAALTPTGDGLVVGQKVGNLLPYLLQTLTHIFQLRSQVHFAVITEFLRIHSEDRGHERERQLFPSVLVNH
jgi:hypothetical protein